MNGRKKANQRWARVDARRLDVAPGGLGLAADPAQVQALAELFEQVSKRQLRRHPACSLTGSAVSRRSRSSASLRSEEHTSELQSRGHLVCRLLLEKKKKHK